MSDSEKMNALDFVINVLREHEKNLDALIERLEEIVVGLPATITETSPEAEAERKAAEPEKAPKAIEAEKAIKAARAPVSVICENWSDFKEACIGAELVTFHQNGALSVKALQGNIIYEYREMVPTRMESLQCGVPVRFQTSLDALEIKRILSRELNVPENKIIKGEIYFSK
ncbi:MAG: hypothetical protein QXK89_05825 [Candidatus Bathyarchaeia archaeon]